jgi:hypothetical protein
MPRYHFRIHNSIGVTEDEEGRELPDLDAARAEGVSGIRSILADDVIHGHVDLGGRLEVTDADGRVLLTVPFAEAVQLRIAAT